MKNKDMTSPATIVSALRSMRVFDGKPNVLLQAACLIERQAACVEALRMIYLAGGCNHSLALYERMERALSALDEPEAR